MKASSKNVSILKIPQRFLGTIKGHLDNLKKLYQNDDPILNPRLLERLSSYASIVTGCEVKCRWGDTNQTDLINTIILNPHDPKDGSAAERRIVINSALEHEVRGHWKFTPRKSFETVRDLDRGIDCDGFNLGEIRNKSHAVKPVFNILEDGRVETRLRWEMPESFKIIALGDQIRPRWRMPEVYLPLPKAYRHYLQSFKTPEKTLCPECRDKIVPQNAICESCFAFRYRWEQITGLLLTAAIPPHTPPIAIVEDEVRDAFELCVPWILNAIRGISLDAIQSSLEIVRILANQGMVPEHPETSHMTVGEATGQAGVQDTEMRTRTQKASGLGSSIVGGQAGDHQVEKYVATSTSEKQRELRDSLHSQEKHAGYGHKNEIIGNMPPADLQSNAQNSSDGLRSEEESSDESRSSTDGDAAGSAITALEKRHDSLKPETGLVKDSRQENAYSGLQSQVLDKLAEIDLQDFDFAAEVNIGRALQVAKDELDSIQAELDEKFAQQLIMHVSGVRAGPGIDIEIRRTNQLRDAYQVLEFRNRERGRRFAREIRDLMSIQLRPQRYQRLGHLDRKQLVNAAVREKSTVFLRSRIIRDLDLAVSINVDVSGSMDQFNQPVNLAHQDSQSTIGTAQLADAVTICAVSMNQLSVNFEVRAFGSFQWIAKTFYERECSGLAGLACEYQGGTDMAPAIRYSRIALSGRMEKDQLLVMMTDGYPFNVEEASKEVHFAKQTGIHVLGVLFDNGVEKRDQTDHAMAQLFGPNGFIVIHSLEQYPTEVGRAIKSILLRRTVPL